MSGLPSTRTSITSLPDLPVTFEYSFDSYKVTYCTNDALLPAR